MTAPANERIPVLPHKQRSKVPEPVPAAALVAGTEVIPLENGRTYVVRLPAEFSAADIEITVARLQYIRSIYPDPAHAPRFVLVRGDVTIDKIEDAPEDAPEEDG